MSEEAANAFVSQLLEDDELWERIQEPGADFTVIGSAQGLCFSPMEFRHAVLNRSAAAQASDELSEMELDAVAGGLTQPEMIGKLLLMREMHRPVAHLRLG